MYHGGSFGSYMGHKVSKLQEQFAAQQGTEQRSTLFAGISIHVNGYTVPSGLVSRLCRQLLATVPAPPWPATPLNRRHPPGLPLQELKQLMALHGGRYENYFSRSTVTHIICSNLTDAKIRQFGKGHPPPVVRPEWIVESIKAGTLLPVR